MVTEQTPPHDTKSEQKDDRLQSEVSALCLNATRPYFTLQTFK